ncbi:MAG: hypothetical protein ABTD50_10935 [Polyangiaceae bacterium]
MRSSKGAGLCAVVVLLAAPLDARADDRSSCLDAATKGQSLRDDHQLVEAREQFRLCASEICPGVVQRDCATWLVDVEKEMPTVVVSARNSDQTDRVEVQVSVDGNPVLTRLDGRAIPMNPGVRAFHFVGTDGLVLDQQVVVRQGEKNQPISVVFELPAKPQSAAGSSSEEHVVSKGPWKTVGWVAGGVGVVGIVVGASFGVEALLRKSDDCDASGNCVPGASKSIERSEAVSDVGWIAGGVLLAAGAALVLFPPATGHANSTAIRVAPMLASDRGGAIVTGSW